MDFKKLSYFLKVAELEHISKAANALHVAQPALSKIIGQLEADLNVKLFDRIGKRIFLNENGRILQRQAILIFNALQDAKAEIADRSLMQRNTVIIAVHAASKLFPGIIAGFNKLYSHIKIAIVQHEEISWENNHCDLIIDSSKDFLSDDCAIKLLEENILLAVPNNHQLALKTKIRLEEAANEAFISLQKGKSLSNITRSYCLDAGFEPNIVLESDDPAIIRGLIGLGLGVAFIPEITWQGVIDSRMKLLEINDGECKRSLYVQWNKDRYLTQSARLFRNYVTDYFNNQISD